MVFSVEINGNEFNFILDSEVGSTILFNFLREVLSCSLVVECYGQHH